MRGWFAPWSARGVKRAARLLLRLYPGWFRSRYGEAYVAAAQHRWERERSGAGAARAYVRTLAHLCGDAVRSVRVVWRQERQVERGGGRRRSMRRLEETANDFRLGVVSLARRPGFSALVVLTLALGIGASAAVYGALDRAILRPLPYPGGDRMAYVAIRLVDRGWQLAPPQAVIDRWRSGSRTVERIEVYRTMSAVRTGAGQAQLVDVLGISGGMPSMLGIRPRVGRVLGPADASSAAPPAVMVSERYWRRTFGSDPAVTSRTLTLNDTLFGIAGVWPESARLDPEGPPDVVRVLPAEAESPPGEFALVLVKLREGASAADVEAELADLLRGIDTDGEFAGELFGGADAVPALNPPYGYLAADYVRGLWLVFAGGLVLMFVAIVNAVNLILGRVESRTGEIGIRLALGGSRARLARLFLAESTVLAAAGVAVGLVVALGVGRVLVAMQPGGPVPSFETGLERRAFGFAILLSAIAALVGGLVPLIPARRSGVRVLLSGAGEARNTRGRSPLRSVLIAAQSALAVLLVVGAVLLVRSFAGLLHVDTGMDLDKLVEVSIEVPADRAPTTDARLAFSRRIDEALAAIPGVAGVTSSSNPPLAYSVRAGVPVLDGEPEPADSGRAFTAVTSAPAGYFRVLGIPLLAGRAFEPHETGVVIVNEAFARSRGDVIGRVLHFPGDTLRFTIVGVAGNVRSLGLRDGADRVQLYHPGSGASAYTRFLLRADGDPAAILAAARSSLASLEPDIPLRQATTGKAILHEQTARSRFVAALLVGFAGLALLFAVCGVYGAVALDVRRRTREMGIRCALGATRRELAGLVVATGMRPVLTGAVVGVVAALWAGPLLEATLFGVSARDPLSAAAAVTLLAITTGISAAIPALRAARVDPNRSLRAE